MPNESVHRSSLRKRLLLVTALLVVAAFVASSDLLRGVVNDLVGVAEDIVRRHPRLGMIAFVVLAGLSALLAFFSSAIVVPVGVKAWGQSTTFVLLWLGWLLGGAATYTIGRYLGRPVIRLFVSEERVAYYEGRISRRAGFSKILLFQLALPSEVPGYVLGTVRYRFLTYLGALAIAELPFALGAVYLGVTLLRGSYILLLIVGAAGLLLSAGAMVYFHRRIARQSTQSEGPRPPDDF